MENMTSICRTDADSLERVLELVERGDPRAVGAAADLGARPGVELSLASSLAISEVRRKAGLFIAVTGIDKSGKETHVFNPTRLPGVRPLVKVLNELGYETMGVHQPEYDLQSGQLIRSYLGLRGDCEISGKLPESIAWVLWSLNRALVNYPAATWLSDGTRAVVAKRWSESNLAYHATQGVDPARILSVESRFMQPDLFLVLDLDPDAATRRIGGIGDSFESRRQLLSAAREILGNLERYFPGSSVIRVDASRDPASVSRDLERGVREFLRR
ncbi:MAG: hypothetical protein C0167_03975 [Nitrososphaera sp.]|nr:MAG: hypothetical protein C0167_03975 [Nitrososphaera sp.]